MSREEQERHKRKTPKKPRNKKRLITEKVNKLEYMDEISKVI